MRRGRAPIVVAASLAVLGLWAASRPDDSVHRISLLAVGVAALVFAGHRLRTNHLRAQKVQLESLVTERTQDLEQAVLWATAAVREADTLRAATEALSGSLDLSQLLQVILTELRRVVDCDGASVQELDGHALRVIAGVGFHDLERVIGLTFDVRTTLDVEVHPDGRVTLKSRAPRIIPDTDALPEFKSDVVGPDRIRSAMWVPLVRGDRLLGLIALDKREPGFYTSEHARLALAFAAQAAVSIENARLFEQARSHARQLERHARELEEAAGALRASEERSRAILETAHDAFVAMDRDGLITAWNAQAEATFGYQRSEALGRPVAQTIVPPEQRGAHTRGLQRYLASGEGPVLGKRIELTALRADGHRFPVELTISAVPGAVPSFAAFIRDITERKRAEEAVARARLLAEEASRAKSAFIASMSHELRTPLNAVLGFAQLMERRPGRDAEDREHLAVINRSGEHLLGLINEVLSIAKIEAGQLSLTHDDFDLAALLAALEGMFRGRATAKGLAYAVQADGPLPPSVRGDDGKLRQILINLVGNAVKFTSAGSVTLRASWSSGRAVFEVEDTGPGLAADEATRLFAAFSQTEAGRRQQEGTGLGLALSRSYARLMGGDITLTSEPGRGSVFRVEVALPESREGRAPRREVRRVERLDAASGRPKVLVVDDHVESRTLLSKLLTSVGFDVRWAADGQAGLDAWRAAPPDLVFMDVNMPVMDGLAATRALRAEESARGLRRTPVVALSASVFEHEREDIEAAGCDRFLAKPFQEEELFELLARMLGVAYVYREGAAVPPPSAPLTRERLRALSEEWRGRFRKAIELADTDAALRLVAEIPPGHDALARDIVERLRAYQVDELEELLGV
ncbi:MAG TPA: PAS domain S-box protein [Vicinamibacteria bacterium]|nr:PAS domain S-box protein [Vicinamibacteria bacterium]